MERIGRWQQFAAAGAIATGNVVLGAIVLTPGSAAATCDIKEGGTGGTVVLSLSAPANGESVVVQPPVGQAIKDPYLSAIAGTGAKLSVLL